MLTAGRAARARRSSACSPRSRWRIRWSTAGRGWRSSAAATRSWTWTSPRRSSSGRKIASSNTHTLLALVRRAGGEPVNLGIARDTPESLREHLAARARLRPAGHHGRHQRRRARLRPRRAGRARRRAAVLEAADAAGRAGRLRAARRHSVDRPAGQSGQHDGDVRAVRPAGDPEDVRTRPALPPHRAGARGRADSASSPGCSISSAPWSPKGRDGPEARLTGPQGSGILTSMVARQRAPRHSGRAVRDPGGATVQALRLDDPVHQRRARVLTPSAPPGFDRVEIAMYIGAGSLIFRLKKGSSLSAEWRTPGSSGLSAKCGHGPEGKRGGTPGFPRARPSSNAHVAAADGVSLFFALSAAGCVPQEEL